MPSAAGDDLRGTPSISVVIPAYDHPAAFVGEAVQSALDQTVPPAEIILVLDGTPPAIASELREAQAAEVDIIEQPNRGMGAARNRGVEASTGELLAFLDSDDVWEADKLERQAAALAAAPELEAVFGRAEQFYDDSADEEYRRRHPLMQPVGDARLSAAMLIRRSAFERVGPYAEAMPGGVDLDWLVAADEVGLRYEVLPAVVYRRRLHPNNFGIINRDAANRARLHAVMRHMKASRGADVGGRDAGAAR